MEQKPERSEFTAWLVTLLAGACLGASLTAGVVVADRGMSPGSEPVPARYSTEAVMVTESQIVMWDISGGRHLTNGLPLKLGYADRIAAREVFRTNASLQAGVNVVNGTK